MLQFMELADYVVVAVALIVGIGVGRRMRPKPIQPICSCSHGYGTHEGGGQCRAEELVQYDGHETHQMLNRCPCGRYDGPDPIIFGLSA